MQSRFRYMTILYIALLAIFIFPFTISAVSPASITINTIPENPKPGDNITVTVGSYSSNLDSVLITWYVSGKKVSGEIGKKSISTTLPVSGGDVTIKAVISLPDGAIEKIVTIKPASITLLWQATDSYVPPFYRGKALPSIGSEIKIIAMPEIKSGNTFINRKNMIYSWKRNYNNDAEASGYGKNSFVFNNDYLEDNDVIEVTASTVDGLYTIKDALTIAAYNPIISLYRNDPNLGTLWENALLNNHRVEDTEVIVAEPYFLSPKEIHSPRLIWNWSINDELVEILGYRKNIIPLTVESGSSGTSRLKLEIENQDQILERAEKEINIEF